MPPQTAAPAPLAPDTPRPSRACWGNWALLAVYVAATVAVAVHHEPWRDEAQPWLMARDAPDARALLSYMGYEGTPGLWFVLLRLLHLAHLPYASMFVLHLLLALAGVCLLLFASPFTIVEKIPIVFGYYLLFEYNIVARSYVLTVLLVLLLATLHRPRFARPGWYAAVLFLLTQSSVHGLLISIPFVGLYVIQARGRASLPRTLLVLGAWLAGVALAAAQLHPPPDMATDRAPWLLPPLKTCVWVAAGSLSDAFAPWLLPSSMLAVKARALFCAIVMLAVLPMFRGRRAAGLLCYGATALLVALFVFKTYGGTRHHGLVLISLLGALWVAWGGESETRGRRWGRAVLPVLLAGQFIAGPIAWQRDLTTPFSGAPAAAQYLLAHGWPDRDMFLAVYPSWAGTAALPYLGPHSAYYMPEYQREGAFLLWTREWQANRDLTPAQVTERVEAAARTAGRRDILLLVSATVWPGLPVPGYDLIAAFPARWMEDESLLLYQRRLAGPLDPP